MRRRQFLLGAFAATGALAGCTGAARDDPDTPSAEIEPVPADSTPSYQFQQGPQNTGVAAEPLDADGSWWETQIDPVSSGFGAADGRVVAGSGGVFHAFDAATGDLSWKVNLGTNTYGVPALADATAYVAMTHVGRAPGGIAAVDLTDGSVRWRAIPRVDVMESPTLTDDRVYAIGGGVDRNVVLAVDAKTGEFRWQHPIGEDSPPPAVADGLVYVAVAGPDDSGLYALDPATGEKQWHVTVSADARTAPTVVEDTVYFGTEEGALHAVPTDGGEERWRVDLGDSVGDGIAATNDVLYVPVDSSMVALDPAGEELWRTECTQEPTPPTVAGDALVTADSEVLCLDVADGDERWRHPVFSRSIGDQVFQGIRATPAVADGTVYAASHGGSVIECGNPDALG